MIVSQEIAPRWHLAVLAELHRGEEALFVVRKPAQVGGNGAGIDHIGAVAVRAFLRKGYLALVDLRRVDAGILLRRGGRRRGLRACRHRGGGEIRRRPDVRRLDHQQTAYWVFTANTHSDPPTGTLASRSSPENSE